MVLDVVEGRTRTKQQKKEDVEERMENAFQVAMDMEDCGVSYNSNKVLCTSTYDVRHRHTYFTKQAPDLPTSPADITG